MARKYGENQTLVSKATVKAKVATKKPVGRPKKVVATDTGAVKRRGRPPKAAVKAPVKKSVLTPKTSSLVTAQPLSSVMPTAPAKVPHPEQLVYETDILEGPIQPPKPVEKKLPRRIRHEAGQDIAGEDAALTVSAKRPVGRPKKMATPESTHPVAASISPTQASNNLSEPNVPLSSGPSAAAPLQPKAAGPESSTLKAAQVVSVPPAQLQRRRRKLLRRLAVSLAALAVLVAAWYFGLHRAPDVAAQNNQLLTQIGKVAVLPSDETPSITTVVDPSQVNQQFLKNAKKGDKVLLYFQSGQAIVYRPSTGQIVNMGPLETPKPRVFIRQGSETNNIAAIQSTISKTSDFVLASEDQSPNKTYAHTVVVDLTGNRPDLAGKLAQLLHVNVVQLPSGEDRPDADLMVIVGSDVK